MAAVPLALALTLAMTTPAAATQVTGGTSSYKNHLPPAPEIHVIGVYETVSHGFQQHVTGNATVRVQYSQAAPMKPITLVLSSYEATVWNIQRDPGAIIEKIVLNGYYGQSLTGANGIPVTSFSLVNGGTSLGSSSYAYAWPQSTGGSSTQGLLIGVEKLLGTRVSSFTGAYQANSFMVSGSPAGTIVENLRLGAGGLFDSANPDLHYNARTGEVRLDLADLAAQYPFGSGDIWWQHFNAQRLFVALANHDSSFNVNGFNAAGINRLGFGAFPPPINNNRLSVDGASLRNWTGQQISLGNLLPPGMSNAATLRQYFAAAHFSTDRQSGEFDLFVIPEPGSLVLAAVFAVPLFAKRRSRRLGIRG